MKKHDHYLKSKLLAWIISSLILALASGCGGGGGGGGGGGVGGGGSADGTLGVSLTDAPACGFDAVNITVAKVRVHQSSSASETDAGWSEITLNPARKINLLDLTNGVIDNLGDVNLTPGHYTQLRLVLEPNTTANNANSVVPLAGVENALFTPSAIAGGIKLINEFDVVSGQRTDLVIDFDACKSVVKRGNGTYSLKPVIKAIPFALNGISGFVDPQLRNSNVLISAQVNGAVVQSTSIKATSGEFLLARLEPGNYDVVISADNHSTAIIASVPVTSTTNIAILSSNVAPINLPLSRTHIVSGTETLSPPSPTEVPYMAAKQTFGTTPIVTVMTLAADNSASGNYLLTLPVDAPLLGQYATGALPIALVAQVAVAGKYTIEASATGYLNQSSSLDLSSADLTQNFVLKP